MEPLKKRVKITDHFRVALKPRDINVRDPFKCHNAGIKNHKQQTQQQQQHQPQYHHHQQQQQHKENRRTAKIEVITINDDCDESKAKTIQRNNASNKYFPPPGLKSPVQDHDATLLDVIWNEPHYAWDSFEYDKAQELKFRTTKYLNNETAPRDRQHHITPRLRARLVDWLVDIQNVFKLDHEPLYLAVKIADQYMMRKPVLKQELELLFMTSIFISVKFDYRPNYLTIPELIQEFAGRYDRKQVIKFELDILSTLDFNIRYPLSYGFLRRFARCTSSHIQTLTLARYILESSLLEYEMIDNLESKMAAASLLLSNKMLRVEEEWSVTAEFYTGYKEQELYPLVTQLNRIISRPPDRKISAVRRKYTNEVFLSVANIEPLDET